MVVCAWRFHHQPLQQGVIGIGKFQQFDRGGHPKSAFKKRQGADGQHRGQDAVGQPQDHAQADHLHRLIPHQANGENRHHIRQTDIQAGPHQLGSLVEMGNGINADQAADDRHHRTGHLTVGDHPHQ